MAILIKDMVLPKNCRRCCFYQFDYDVCILYSYGIPVRRYLKELEKRPDWCELEEVKNED